MARAPQQSPAAGVHQRVGVVVHPLVGPGTAVEVDGVVEADDALGSSGSGVPTRIQIRWVESGTPSGPGSVGPNVPISHGPSPYSGGLSSGADPPGWRAVPATRTTGRRGAAARRSARRVRAARAPGSRRGPSASGPPRARCGWRRTPTGPARTRRTSRRRTTAACAPPTRRRHGSAGVFQEGCSSGTGAFLGVPAWGGSSAELNDPPAAETPWCHRWNTLTIRLEHPGRYGANEPGWRNW